MIQGQGHPTPFAYIQTAFKSFDLGNVGLGPSEALCKLGLCHADAASDLGQVFDQHSIVEIVKSSGHWGPLAESSHLVRTRFGLSHFGFL